MMMLYRELVPFSEKRPMCSPTLSVLLLRMTKNHGIEHVQNFCIHIYKQEGVELYSWMPEALHCSLA